MEYAEGVHLTRTDENVDEIDALATRLGGRVGLDDVLDDLDRKGRRSLFRARAIRRAYTFDAADRRDPRWWPQGVTTSADASDEEEIAGRRIVAVAWYAKELPGDEVNQGSRITFFDLGTRRYRHVLLVKPVLKDGVADIEPLTVHAGGIVWFGPYLHVAATAKGFHTCRLDDLLRVSDDEVAAYGHRYVLPVRFSYQAETDEGHERLRYSFMSLDKAASPPDILAGEYGRGDTTRRLARFPVDPETLLLATEDDGIARGRRCSTRESARCRARWWPGAATTSRSRRVRRRSGRSTPASPARSSGIGGRRRWGRRTSPTGPRPTSCGRSASGRGGAGSSRCAAAGSTEPSRKEDRAIRVQRRTRMTRYFCAQV